MICKGCGNDKAYAIRFVRDYEACDRCGGFSTVAAMPDVFWNNKPYYSEALDVEFTSREQKARVMKEKGVVEAGDMKMGQKSWVEGSREARKASFEKDRPMIRENIRKFLNRTRG